jgi:hypothetical protein
MSTLITDQEENAAEGKFTEGELFRDISFNSFTTHSISKY